MADSTPAIRDIRDLPGPRGVPLMGSLHRFGLHNVHLVVERWCERYGSLYTFRAGLRRYVVISDREAANALLRERPQGFRRQREVEAVYRELGFHGVFSVEGEDWRRQRRLAVTALNSNRLHSHFHIIRTATERLRRRLKAAATESRPIEIQRELTSYTVDITTALAFGVDVNTLERGEDELQQNIQFTFEMLGRRVLLPIPYWRWIRLPADRRLKRALAALEVAVRGFIVQARQQLEQHPERREEPTNFLEAMLAAQLSDGSFDDGEIFGNTMTLLFAGEDTTAHSMAWALWYLAREPEAQERWAQEATEVLGDDPVPADHETVGRLLYGDAVLRESMRLKAVAPALMHEPLADVEIAGVRIPARTRIVIPTRHINREACGREFDPDRWLDGKRAPDQRSFLAFGAGPRFCPGRNLAMLEARSAMAMIARDFELELDESGGPVKEYFGFVMVPRGLRVRLRERVPAERSVTTGPPALS
ncbi:MAG TPA: cytochrome P450 [Solirubrobacterales bacterium]|nr:cytochrome P450 [Solirubrobacterales bacterium]